MRIYWPVFTFELEVYTHFEKLIENYLSTQIHKYTNSQRHKDTAKDQGWPAELDSDCTDELCRKGGKQTCEKKNELQLVNSHISAPCNNSTPWLQLLLGFPFPPLVCSCSRHPSCAQMQDHPRLQRKSRIVKRQKVVIGAIAAHSMCAVDYHVFVAILSPPCKNISNLLSSPPQNWVTHLLLDSSRASARRPSPFPLPF